MSQRCAGLVAPSTIKLKVLKDQSGHVRFVGHPVIYGQAIDIIDETLSRASLSYESLSLEPDGDYYRLNWDAINDGSGTKSKSTELLRNAKKRSSTFSRPMGLSLGSTTNASRSASWQTSLAHDNNPRKALSQKSKTDSPHNRRSHHPATEPTGLVEHPRGETRAIHSA